MPAKFSNYNHVFSFDLAIKLPENLRMNQHAMEQIDKKQLLYGPSYSFSLMGLEILKIYIETHLKMGFIWPFESHIGALILFNKKHDGSFHLYIYYLGFNNLIIKNLYSLFLIKETLARLDWAKQFS